MEVSVYMDIPDELVPDFISGALDINKAVVRCTDDGRIMKHIDLLIESESIEDAKQAAKNKLVLLGIGLVAVSITIGVLAFKVKKNRLLSRVELPEYVFDFQNKFLTYLNETKEGNLNINSICELLLVLDKIETAHQRDITIDFSTAELRILIHRVYAYTLKLAEVTNNPADGLPKPSIDSSRNICLLKNYLLHQKFIVENAA